MKKCICGNLIDHYVKRENCIYCKIEKLKKELELKNSWVKHHQKSVENALRERNSMNKWLLDNLINGEICLFETPGGLVIHNNLCDLIGNKEFKVK